MRFFKAKLEKPLVVVFEDLQSIIFKDMVFHLSGYFVPNKRKFGEKIIDLGGKIRGVEKGKEYP